MDMHQEMDLQLFADAGTLVNAGGNYVTPIRARRPLSRRAAA